jgi:N-acetylmuramoyl-L-alanine amidase
MKRGYARMRRQSVLILGALAVLALVSRAPHAVAGSTVVVAIDAGHGGIDPGAIAGGLVEKDVALTLARLLAARLDRTPGLTGVLLRTDDSFLTLTERIRRARRAGANLLVSLHADTTAEGIAEGAHVYVLSPEGTDEAARELAERENRADVIGGVALTGEPDDLATLLVDLAQRGTVHESRRLAAAVLGAMAGEVALLPTEPLRGADFRVLKAPEIPAILVELGYLSNERDRARIASPVWRRRMAAALARGIQEWTRQASPGFLTPKR